MKNLLELNKEVSDLKEQVKGLLNTRRSHSLRIKAMKHKMDNVIASHKYYIRHRLPMVIANHKKKMEFFNRYGDWRKRFTKMFDDVGRHQND